MNIKIISIIPCIAMMVACNGTNSDKSVENGDVVMTGSPDLTTVVDTMTVRQMPFTSDVVSNGRVKATESAELFFRSTELIKEVKVKNGQRVKKGDPLAELDMFKLEADKSRREAALAQARLELQDVLIGQGYNPDNLSVIPDNVMKLARVRSGLEQAEADYNTTLKDIEHATLTAPFDGVIANVKGTPHSMASASEPFCRIINDTDMCVEFAILESELQLVQPGEQVEVTPYNGGNTSTGNVTEINPMIDENGHVTVKAHLNGGRSLVDGMNVRIRSSHSLGNRIVVPKSAVVLRTGRQVVFTYDNGKAMWNYITTGLENFDSYEITDGLSEGEILIIKGNENLAHEAPVTIKL